MQSRAGKSKLEYLRTLASVDPELIPWALRTIPAAYWLPLLARSRLVPSTHLDTPDWYPLGVAEVIPLPDDTVRDVLPILRGCGLIETRRY
jgi:hypothetical protein